MLPLHFLLSHGHGVDGGEEALVGQDGLLRAAIAAAVFAREDYVGLLVLLEAQRASPGGWAALDLDRLCAPLFVLGAHVERLLGGDEVHAQVPRAVALQIVDRQLRLRVGDGVFGAGREDDQEAVFPLMLFKGVLTRRVRGNPRGL